MPNKTKFVSAESAEEIREYRRKVKNKYTDRRLYAVQLRGEGYRNKDIAEKLNADPRQVSEWVRLFLEGGIDALNNEKGGGRPLKMSYEEEEELLHSFVERFKNGEEISVSDIRTEYEKIAGANRSHGHIYRLLKRHGWVGGKPQIVLQKANG